MHSPCALTNMSAIVSVCDDWGIGKCGALVVANRDDMQNFVRLTRGKTVIMGRKTLESLPKKQPLKNRRNIVLTRSPALYDAEYAPCADLEFAHSREDALALVAHDTHAWVIGGGSIYAAFLPYCQYCFVTRNHCIRPCDTYFPDLDALPEWTLVRREKMGVTSEGIPFEFTIYQRSRCTTEAK